MAECRPKKIIMWSIFRATSTAFLRAMMNHSNTKVFLEPFGVAYFYGEERKSNLHLDKPPLPNKTFADVKRVLEQDIPDGEICFVKDFAFHLEDKADYKYIPDNYVHTFLIRHPRKTIPSLYKISNSLRTGYKLNPIEVGFRPLLQMYTYVTEELGQKSIIIDSDDLLRHPEAVLRKYCTHVGIEYEDGMTNWEHPMKDTSVLGDWSPVWFDRLVQTPTFQAPVEEVQTEGLPQDVLDLIEENNSYYQILYEKRIKLN